MKKALYTHEEILIVEDSPTQAEQLQHILERHGYRVSVAANGKQALARMDHQRPALVISDIVMPEMDGYEFCRTIKSNNEFRNIPVILLTSLSDPADIIRGLLCAADNFVVKPYDEKYLLSRIEYILVNRELRKHETSQLGVEIFFAGQKHSITSDRLQILDLLFSTYETAVQKNLELIKAQEALKALNEQLERKVEERTAALTAEIAERKKAEEKTREQAALLDIDPDAILVKDMDDRITFWNKGAERLYGWTKEEVLGRRVPELLPQQVHPRYEEAKNIVKQQGTFSAEWSEKKKDGAEIIVETHWTLVRDAAGAPKAIYVVDSDITEKKKLEAQFLRTQRLESLGTLAGGIAHDLNNVLGPILISFQMLRKRLPGEENQKLLDLLESTVRRGSGMVKQILTFARGVEGERMVIHPKHLIGELEGMIRDTFPKSIEVKTRVPKELWTITGDATQLQQVLLNLCVNARDAMPNGGKLEIAAENVTLGDREARANPDAKQGPYIVLTVSDSGTGMPPEVLERIFEPFFTTKEQGKGTGLGLATSIGIVKSHGGFITVQSAMGRGTQFKVCLPAAPSVETQRAQREKTSAPSGHEETILLVDDELSIREITRESLELFGYKVLTAGDGAEAVLRYNEHKDEIQAVICDMMMPVMDGPNTIRALKKINPQLKCIAVSGLMEDPKIIEFARAETQVTLQKPYTTDQLLTSLRAVLDQTRNPGLS